MNSNEADYRQGYRDGFADGRANLAEAPDLGAVAVKQPYVIIQLSRQGLPFAEHMCSSAQLFSTSCEIPVMPNDAFPTNRAPTFVMTVRPA